ncbi:MAG: type I restriction endonuclease subunit R [Bacteroidota bacterium]
MSQRVTENTVEEAAIAYFAGETKAAGQTLEGLGYAYQPGLAVEDERGGPAGVVLERRFRAALQRLNPDLSSDTLDLAAREVLQPQSAALDEANRRFTRQLQRGVEVEVRTEHGTRGARVRLVDYDNAEANDWLVVNQLTVEEQTANRNVRRPDLVVYLNGLPVAVAELKNVAGSKTELADAWQQFETYKDQIPSLFVYNVALVLSDGRQAHVGSLTAPLRRFGPWRTMPDGSVAPEAAPALRTLVEGFFAPAAFLDVARHFQVWETDPDSGRLVKKLAADHQRRAVNRALGEIKTAIAEDSARGGVVWHTQGSGKSVSMAFLAAKALVTPSLKTPTVLVLTDRTALDDQLFGQFAAVRDLLPAPEQAETREHLRDLLATRAGGIVFSTLQKFGTRKDEAMPVLTERRNVIVLADEAHRSHYDFTDGLARNLRDALPHATFVGFTGTPLELSDRSTSNVFGDYVDTYTISEAIADDVIVPLSYENRLATLDLPEEAESFLDEGFEEVTEDQEIFDVARIQRKWKQLEAVVGLPARLRVVAKDIVAHYERRIETLEGKAMVVGMSRRICAELYREIVKLRPEWHSDKDEEGQIKVVITGSASDEALIAQHVRSKARRAVIEKRFKEPIGEVERRNAEARQQAEELGQPPPAPEVPLRLVIVRDMWLTGFDVPSAHTLYVDKPMQGHSLMQAIARVNRVFADKPGGLIVDYIGLADPLRKAVETYSRYNDQPTLPIDEALGALRTAVGRVRDLFHGFDLRDRYVEGGQTERVEVYNEALDHLFGLGTATDERGRERTGPERYHDAMASLRKAAGLALHLEAARDLRDEIALYEQLQQSVRKQKKTGGAGASDKRAVDFALRRLVSASVHTDEVVDLFEMAGLEHPDLSILSDAFLERVRAVPHENLQRELLERIVRDQIRSQRRQNVVQADRFSEALKATLNRYHNRSLETAQVIAELIELAKTIRALPDRAAELGLTNDELAFYDALAAQDGVTDVMDDDALGAIAKSLADTIRRSATIDWTKKEAVRARMRARVKRLLRRHGYPPEKQESAVETVIHQAEVLASTTAAS